VFGVWLTGSAARPLGWRGVARRVAGALAGGAPFLAAIALYNDHFFGSPFRFGYDAALGPAMRLGFHRDPWGNLYGPVEALAYTSSDLVALSLNLLEAPIPIVALAGVYLLCVRRLSAGERTIAIWALLPVVANFFYWHHGLWMGPRMLNEAAPAWALLTAAAAVGLVQRVPAERTIVAGRYSLRVGLTVWLLAAWTVGLTYLAPERLASYGRGGYASVRIEPPQTPEPSLVFVHGAWSARVAMLLAGRGMRLDSVETAMRQNSICAVHHFAQVYPGQGGAGAGKAVLDFVPRSGYPPGFSRVEIAPGVLGLARKDEAFSPSCAREIGADRNGVVDVA